MKKNYLLAAIALCVLTAALCGCVPSPSASPSASPVPTPSPSPSPEEVSPSPDAAQTGGLSAVYDAVYDVLKADMLASGNYGESDFPEDRTSLPMLVITHLKKDDEAFTATMEALGFDAGAIDEFLQFQPMMNINSDNIIVILASDTAAAKTSLEAYHQGQYDLWSTYLPQQFSKVEKNVLKESENMLYYVTAEEGVQPEIISAIENK